jgi:hypothetical protein
MMSELGRGAAFNVDSGSRVLHKEIGGRDVVGDHPAKAYRIAQRSFIGAEMAHLIRLSEQGERRGARLPAGEGGAECEKQKNSEQRFLWAGHEVRRTHDCTVFDELARIS